MKVAELWFLCREMNLTDNEYYLSNLFKLVRTSTVSDLSHCILMHTTRKG